MKTKIHYCNKCGSTFTETKTRKKIEIITAEHGSNEQKIDVSKIHIHDLWHIAMRLEDPNEQKIVLEIWDLAHDMRGALQAIANGANISKPIHTK